MISPVGSPPSPPGVVAVAVAMTVGDGTGVDAGSDADVAVGSGADAAVGSGVDVAVGIGVDVAVGSGVGVDVAVGTGVGVAVGVGVGGGPILITDAPPTACFSLLWFVSSPENMYIPAVCGALTV